MVIAKKLRQLLVWVFRTTTVKGKVQQKNMLRQIQKSLIEGINKHGAFLEDKSWISNEIKEEFENERTSTEFYQELENYHPRDKHNRS